MDNYKTTFNYLLTHRVIPQMMFSGLDFFYANIMNSPDSIRQFLLHAHKEAAAFAEQQSEIEPAWPIEQFEIRLFGETIESGIVIASLPRYEKDCDCVEIAFPLARENARYFTSELSTNILDNDARYLTLGEWTPKGDNLSHHNYGAIDLEKGASFPGMIAALLEKSEKEEADEAQYEREKLPLNADTTYEGETANGKPHGKGKWTSILGSAFEGEFAHGNAVRGKLTFPNGQTYEGSFLDGDYYHGTGKHTFPNGDVYEGNFVDGKLTGKGKYTYYRADGICIDEGDFVDAELHGKGKRTYPDGRVERGNWKNGEFQGKGLLAGLFGKNKQPINPSNEKNTETEKMFAQAIAFWIEEDYQAAFPLFETLAKQNHAEARLYLGECYDSGYAVPQNRKKAARLFLQSAQQGLAQAQYRVSLCYANDVSGFSYNRKQYTYWKEKAERQGYGSKEFNKEWNERHALQNAARHRRNAEELERLGLATVSDLENLMRPLIKNATKITPKRTEKFGGEAPEDVLSGKELENFYRDTLLKSHFGGQPYFEKGEKWPSAQDGDSLEFIFQIFNNGFSGLPETIRLVQFFYDYDRSPISYTEDGVHTGYKYGWYVKIYEQLDIENSVIIERPDGGHIYCDIEFAEIKSLPDIDNRSIDHTIEILSDKINAESEEKSFDIYSAVADKLTGSGGETQISQLGGYPVWIQGDCTPGDKDYQLLFQLDSEDEAGLHWVDCGMIYVFYNPKTKGVYFEMQFY
jgi:uncharacterized protein YwqG